MKIVYFAWVKDRIGIAEETLDLPVDIRTVADFLAWLPTRGANYANALQDPALIRVALDQEFAQPDAVIGETQEIAVFPPVTGG
ncbi:molybdopterin converting factor subunit 1 [uncultured Thalassospira sp.]|jgi:molybdopterin synthase sulfur carrier subunit|uniref:molybdopterin converting factor subunit 1 n=1 Tax=uncultured Thalassospira sp. TaxID=404382 RepID=UPI0030D8A0D4|tara:strand:- start:6408 stop:6659 length:252 start_codon:yes stop_codon:yes gene_type:complete